MNVVFHCSVGPAGAHLWHYGLMIAVPFAAAVPLAKVRSRAATVEVDARSEDDARRARLFGSIGMRRRT